MKEVITMWKYTRMIILVSLSAAIYAALLIVFKGGIPIVPGITEVRPANVFPAIFGLMFGPAGAWGSAIGNFIGDVFGGTLGWGSIAGLIGNFFLGFIPYKMWGALGLVPKDNMEQKTDSFRKLAAYLIIVLTSSAACAIIIAWYLDLAGIVPFAALGIIITLNNFIAQAVLGPPLLLLLYPRIEQWGLLWTEIMREEDVGRPYAKGVGVALMIIGALGGLIIGLGTSTGLYGQELFQFGAGEARQVGVWLSVLPFIILIFVASVMLSGREQFVEEYEDF
jgi:energy-coupling factor transport system substrate-specific component